jgi:hypothetical protein
VGSRPRLKTDIERQMLATFARVMAAGVKLDRALGPGGGDRLRDDVRAAVAHTLNAYIAAQQGQTQHQHQLR